MHHTSQLHTVKGMPAQHLPPLWHQQWIVLLQPGQAHLFCIWFLMSTGAGLQQVHGSHTVTKPIIITSTIAITTMKVNAGQSRLT